MTYQAWLMVDASGRVACTVDHGHAEDYASSHRCRIIEMVERHTGVEPLHLQPPPADRLFWWGDRRSTLPIHEGPPPADKLWRWECP